MKQIKYVTVFLLVLLLTGCAAQRYTKKGVKYEQAGLYESAVENYLFALYKKNTYIDARLGLMRSASLYRDQLEQNIEQYYAELNDDKVVDNFLKLQQLQNQTASYQVDVQIDARIIGMYDEAKNRYLLNYYQTAQQLLSTDMFDEAAKYLEKILKVDATYNDTRQLYVYSKCEPLYRAGEIAFANEKYRTAYALYGQVIKISRTYRDAAIRQTESLDKGILTVAFLPVERGQQYPGFSNTLISSVKSAVQKANDPFLKFVDYSTNQLAIQEQKYALSNNLDMKTGQMLPIKSYLKCKIITVSSDLSKLNKEKRKGFIRHENSKGEVSYTKVYYYAYSQSKQFYVQMAYEWVSSETGALFSADNFSVSYSSSIDYLYYNGRDDLNLRTGNWDKIDTKFNPEVDKVNDSYYDKSDIRTKVNGNKTFPSTDQVLANLASQSARKISRVLISFNPEK